MVEVGVVDEGLEFSAFLSFVALVVIDRDFGGDERGLTDRGNVGVEDGESGIGAMSELSGQLQASFAAPG